MVQGEKAACAWEEGERRRRRGEERRRRVEEEKVRRIAYGVLLPPLMLAAIGVV